MSENASLIVPKDLRVTVIGVGSAGSHAIDGIARTDLAQLPLAVVHTHARVLSQQAGATRVLIGVNRTHGLGTGGDADLARVMAEEDFGRLSDLVQNMELLFIVAGMGGGTGTGVAPVLARAAREQGALVIAIVTMPFEFEGLRRQKQAQSGVQTLRSVADAVICIPNQRMSQLLNGNTTVLDAFSVTNDLLAQGIRGIWRMLTRPGLINVDFAYLHSVLRGRHTESVLAAAVAEGEDRCDRAVEQLLSNPILEGGETLAEADQVLVSVVGPRSLTIAEVNSLLTQLRRHTRTEEVVIGTAIDETMGERVEVTVVAAKGGKPSMAAGGEVIVEVARQPEPQNEANFLDETPRPAPRFVAPPPESTPEKTRELMQKHPSARMRKSASKWKQEVLPLEIVSRGRFEKSEPTIHRGADLDVPTYVRRGVPLN